MRRIDPWDTATFALVVLIGALVGFLLTSCHHRALEAVVAAPAAARPRAEAETPAVAKAVDDVADARERVVELKAQLAFAEALLEVRQEAKVAIKREAEQDARQAQVAAQARWLTWIAGLLFLAGIAAAVAGFWLPIPKRWGAIAAAGGLALLVAARVWSWAGAHALPIGLTVLAVAGAAALRAWWRTAGAARHIALIGDRLETAEGSARDLVKAAAYEAQKHAGIVDLVRRLRGKPRAT